MVENWINLDDPELKRILDVNIFNIENVVMILPYVTIKISISDLQLAFKFIQIHSKILGKINTNWAKLSLKLSINFQEAFKKSSNSFNSTPCYTKIHPSVSITHIC